MTPIHTSSQGIRIYCRVNPEGNLQYLTHQGDLIWEPSLVHPELLLLAIAAHAAPSCHQDLDDEGEPIEGRGYQRRVDDPGYDHGPEALG